MARTAVELPDPLENAGGAATGGADDLLAQLAGDEVDRLMSEADAGPPDPAHADRLAFDAESVDVGAALTGADDAVADDLGKSRAAMDELFDEMDAADAASAAVKTSGETNGPEPAVGAGSGSAVASKSAAAVIEERAEALVGRARREADEAAAIAAEPGPQDAPPSAAAALAAEMDADEAAHAAALARIKPARVGAKPVEAPVESALAAESVEAVTTIDEAAVDLSAAEDVATERVPILVRVLEFINAPLAGLSGGVREALGKVAIVTAVNAVAVFVYVLIFRRH